MALKTQKATQAVAFRLRVARRVNRSPIPSAIRDDLSTAIAVPPFVSLATDSLRREGGNMHIRGGYRAMTPIHVCNALAAYDDGLVRYRTLRTYFACVAVLAAREAASRVRGERPRSAGEAVHAAELAKLTGTTAAVAATDLRRLAKVGLVTMDRDVVHLADEALPCAVELLELVSPSRSWSRPVPVPRPWLRFLATCTRPAVAKVLLAHGLRGLSLERGTGAVRNRGTLKSTWVADTFAVSLRAV